MLDLAVPADLELAADARQELGARARNVARRKPAAEVFPGSARHHLRTDEAAVYQYQGLDALGEVCSRADGDVAAPGMPEQDGLLDAENVEQADRVGCERRPVVAVAGLRRAAVAALVGGDDAESFAQKGSQEVVPVGGRGQPVQRQHGSAAAAPVEVPHPQGAHLGPPFDGPVLPGKGHCHMNRTPQGDEVAATGSTENKKPVVDTPPGSPSVLQAGGQRCPGLVREPGGRNLLHWALKPE